MTSRRSQADRHPETDDALQSDVLENLTDARRYRRWLADLALPHLGDSPIEVGSGIGDYVADWLPRVRDITATECSEDRLLRIKSRFVDSDRVTVRELTLPTNESADHTAAVSLNVLEHIADHVGALRSMAGLVRPGGRVVVLVPAFEFAMSRFDRSIGHLRRYTRSSLEEAFVAAGLRGVRSRYVNPIGLVNWTVAVRGLRMTPRNGPLVRFFDRVLVPPQRLLERRFQPPFGQSVLAVAPVPDAHRP